MATVISPPEERVVLQHVAWETYERLLADHLDSSVPRFTYDRGVLEIVSPSLDHERTKASLTSLVEIVADERGLEFFNFGSMTFKREDLAQGFEPDVTFYFASEPVVRGRDRIDPAVDPPPDLVIEIDVSRHSLNKLPIYAAFGVPEVWRVRNGIVTVYVRKAGSSDEYAEDVPSLVLPPLTGEILTRFLAQRVELGRAAWVRSIHSWARGVD